MTAEYSECPASAALCPRPPGRGYGHGAARPPRRPRTPTCAAGTPRPPAERPPTPAAGTHCPPPARRGRLRDLPAKRSGTLALRPSPPARARRGTSHRVPPASRRLAADVTWIPPACAASSRGAAHTPRCAPSAPPAPPPLTSGRRDPRGSAPPRATRGRAERSGALRNAPHSCSAQRRGSPGGGCGAEGSRGGSAAGVEATPSRHL